ncbi:MAG TPA: hypothetical protein VNE40_01290 [Candidatus Dormibacteraeota bacterium]|nr:hypothetical protein [Candidatus Dormibacteraeota bacterium]
MVIIGLCGAIGHGKTTLGGYLAGQTNDSLVTESSHLIIEVANALVSSSQTTPSSSNLEAINIWLQPLPAILKETVMRSVRFDQLKLSQDQLAKDPENYQKLFEFLDQLGSSKLQSFPINVQNKRLYRGLLQWLGGYLVQKVDPGIWFDEIIRRLLVMPKQPALAIIGGVRFPADAERIRKQSGYIVEIVRSEIEFIDSQDITERQRTSIHPDCVVYNNGTLQDLRSCTKQLYIDTIQGRLQKSYHSHVSKV